MITLIIKNKDYKNTTYKYKTTLKREGFTFNDSKRQWEKNITKVVPASIKKDTREYKKKIKKNKNYEKKQIKKYKKMCKTLNLTFIEKDSNYTRSSSYRNEYFKKHPHGIIGNYYQCAYCGKFVKKENLTVDHLFPIKRVEKGKSKKLWRAFLKIKGIKNVNQSENLVGACWRCNSEKGTKLKKWYIKGCLGRHFVYWVIVWMISISLLFSGIDMLFYLNIINF